MGGFFSSLKNKLGASHEDDDEIIEQESEDAGYVEIDTATAKDSKDKIVVKPYTLESFEEIKPILDDLRAGSTICLINIKPLKEKDLVELKRAINKLKKTTDAVDGEIAGFDDDYIVVTPSFAKIHKSKALPTGDDE